MLTWEAHAGAVTSLAFVPGGGLLSTGTDEVVKYWEPTTSSENWRYRSAGSRAGPPWATPDVLRVLADATGRYAAVGLRYEGVRFLDLADGKEVEHFELTEIVGMAPAPNHESVFVVGRESRMASRDTSRLYQHTYPPGKVIAVSQSRAVSGPVVPNRDCSRILAGRAQFHWPAGDPGYLPILYPGGQPHAVSADGDKLFGFQGTRLVVWGFLLGTFRRKIKGHLAPITGLTSTPDGRKLWTASLDATVRQWDVDTYRCEKCYGLKIGPLGCVAVSPDGLTAAAGSRHNGRIAVWDLD